MKRKSDKTHKKNIDPSPDDLLRQAEEKLQESEERYKSLFNRSLDIIYIHDLEGQFLDANDAAFNRLGYKKEDVRSLNFASFLSEDQIPLAFQLMESILAGTHQGLMEFRLRFRRICGNPGISPHVPRETGRHPGDCQRYHGAQTGRKDAKRSGIKSKNDVRFRVGRNSSGTAQR